MALSNPPSTWVRVWQPRLRRLRFQMITFSRSASLRYLLMLLGGSIMAWLVYSQVLAPLQTPVELPAGLPPTRPEIERRLVDELVEYRVEAGQHRPRLFPASERLFPQARVEVSPTPAPPGL